jgi:glycosyltransferase involved in cell wall biosynthesis
LKKIAIINQDSGYLMVDIANSFHDNGYECMLIAGRLVERDTALNPGIKVIKIKRYDRTSNFRRVVSWLTGTIQILLIILFRLRNFHLFMVTNPPFVPLLPLFIRNKFSLMIFDIYPDAIIEFGVLKRNSILIKGWIRANEIVFKKADHIFTLTAGMRKALSRYVGEEKIRTIPLWTTNKFLKPVPKNNNSFIAAHKLQGKFIVLYSGNFGIAHYINLIIDLASRIVDERIMFVLIGGGPTENDIKQKIRNLNLKNCIILPWQDPEVLPYSLASADLAIVTLSENALKLGIPSKLFSYLSAGAPILCITGSGSELERVILDYNIGRSFTPDNIEGMIQYIIELINDHSLSELYHNNSLGASKYHTLKNVDLIIQCYV